MVLEAESTIYRHTKGKTLYIAVPALLSYDNEFKLKEGKAKLRWDVETQALVITQKEVRKK